MKYDFLLESLRQYIAAAAPNFVMRDDLMRLEGRVDELLEIAANLEHKLRVKGHPGSRESQLMQGDDKRRRPRL